MGKINLSELAKRKGMTLQDIADRLGVTKQAVSNRAQHPSAKSLQDFARVLGCTVSDLYQKEGSTQSIALDPSSTATVTTCPCCGAQLRITLSPLAPPPHTEEGTEADEER